MQNDKLPPEEETLDSHFANMDDEEFAKALNKQQTSKKSSEIARLKKEASRHLTLSDQDKKLKSLAEDDGREASLAKGDEVLNEEKRIVGKDKRTEVTDLSSGAKLTTE